MNDMIIARQALADLLLSALVAVDADYRVEQRLRRATFDSRDRADRLIVMGDKSTYAEVRYIGRSGNMPDMTTGGKPVDVDYAFRVHIWYGYYDAATYAASSEAVFDTICESAILPLLESTTFIGSGKFLLYNPESISVQEVTLDNQGQELAHLLNFTIGIRQ